MPIVDLWRKIHWRVCKMDYNVTVEEIHKSKF